MMEKRGILVLVAVVSLLAAGGLTAPTITSHPASRAEAPTISFVDLPPGDACDAGAGPAPGEDHSESVKPGCCATQCNVDKDCDRICGKGVCACIQETPCCRRCVY